MIDEEDFDAIADDTPEMAFVRLESKFRRAFKANLDNDNNNSFAYCAVEYINHTLSAAEALGLDFLDFWTVPKSSENDIGDKFQEFTRSVDTFIVKTRIAHVRSNPKGSVALEASEKLVLRHYVEQIKTVIDNSTLVVTKRERLYDKINAFLEEVDKERTPLQRFTDIITTLAHLGGDAAEAMEPAWKWVKLIGAVLGARQETEQVRLPPPPKRLEAPKPQLPKPKGRERRKSMDDEIPF
jgi:hypothetical protein